MLIDNLFVGYLARILGRKHFADCLNMPVVGHAAATKHIHVAQLLTYQAVLVGQFERIAVVEQRAFLRYSYRQPSRYYLDRDWRATRIFAISPHWLFYLRIDLYLLSTPVVHARFFPI